MPEPTGRYLKCARRYLKFFLIRKSDQVIVYLPDMDFAVNKVDLPCQPWKSTLPREDKKLRQPVKILEAAFDNFIFFVHAVAGSDLGWHGRSTLLTAKSMSGKYTIT